MLPKNIRTANKGALFEEEVKYANQVYELKGVALVQKISTPWVVVRDGLKIVSAFPEGKSTLDFRGTVKGGMSISFDCKESEHKLGLPLKNILSHQIDYMRKALYMGEVSFILCYMVTMDKRFLIPGDVVIKHWDDWQKNKGKRGYNLIPLESMREIRSKDGVILDYLSGLGGETDAR